jgi:hypothetical protein
LIIILRVLKPETSRITKTVREIGLKIKFQRSRATWDGLNITLIHRTKEPFGKDS